METEDGTTASNLEITWAYFTGEGEGTKGLSSNVGKQPSKDGESAAGDSRLSYLMPGQQKNRRANPRELNTGSRGYTFLQAMRLINCKFGLDGEMARMVDRLQEPVVLTQPSKFSLTPSMLGDAAAFEDHVQLQCHFFGLFGNAGPMPEYVCKLIQSIELDSEIDSTNDQMALVEFLNLFNHKMLMLYSESWALFDPATKRFTKRDPYLAAVDSISGSVSKTDSHSHIRRRVPYLFSGGRPTSDGLSSVLSAVFSPRENSSSCWFIDEPKESAVLACAVVENVPEWLDTPPDLRVELNSRLNVSGSLGQGIYLGTRILSIDNSVAIKISVVGLNAYLRFLCGNDWHQLLKDIVLEYLGWEYTVQLWVVVDDKSADGRHSILGNGRDSGYCALGQSSWLGCSTVDGAETLTQRTVKSVLVA